MKHTHRIALILFTLLLGLFLAGCNPPEEDGGESGQQTTSQTGDSDTGSTGGETGPIRIGLDLELSGDTATFGQSARKGFEMVINRVNNEGGVRGRQIELVAEDNRGQPTEAKNAANKLIHQQNVLAIVGAIESTNTLNITPVAQSGQTPMITPGSTNPAVTVTEDGSVKDWVFRATFTDNFAGATIAQFVRDDLEAERIAIFYDNSNDYSRGVYTRVMETFENLGGEVVAEGTFTPQDDDFRAKLTRFTEEDFDVLVVPGYYNQAGQIISQAREVGLEQTIVGPDGWDSSQLIDVAGEAANGNYYITHFAPDLPEDQFPQAREFTNSYQAQYQGEQPDAIGMMGYNAGLILVEALRQADELTREGVRDALGNVSGVEGVTGTLSMDENHNISEPAVVVKIEDGQRTFHKLIQPEDLEVDYR